MARSKKYLAECFLLIAFIIFAINLKYSSSETIKNSFQKLSSSVSLQISPPENSTYPLISNISLGVCSIMCSYEDDCQCVTFTNNICARFHVWKDKVVVKKDSLAESFCKKSDHGFKVFAFEAGSNISLRYAYSGDSLRDNYLPHQCVRSSCNEFFRSFLIDVWKYLPVKLVWLIVNAGTDMHTLKFNGKNTNSTNWFGVKTTLQTPFPDFPKFTGRHLEMFGSGMAFGMLGTNTPCQNHTAWMLVTTEQEFCGKDYFSMRWPTIVVTKTLKISSISLDHFNINDKLSIYIEV